MHWHEYWHQGWGPVGMGWMWVWWVLVAIAFVAVIWTLVRLAGRHIAQTETPEDILRQRYARGEVDRDTYLQMLADLRGLPGPGEGTPPPAARGGPPPGSSPGQAGS